MTSDCRKGDCCAPPVGKSPRFRRALWVALAVNGLMFALGNIAVLLAALGVFGTGSGWPDLVVAAIMAALAVFAAASVVKQSLAELRYTHEPQTHG